MVHDPVRLVRYCSTDYDLPLAHCDRDRKEPAVCGIAGIVSPTDANLIHNWLVPPLHSLQHRGPDDHGWLTIGPSGLQSGRGDSAPTGDVQALLLHRRLSILDLSASGWQPMSTADGRFHLVFNGEIYNYIELREELCQAGYTFHSQSDTEVLLQALAHWGTAALTRLVGMFALALLDARERTLLLARDFFGIKPLYYVRSDTAFAFASEIKALLELPFVRREIDPQRLYEYLRLGRTDHAGGTLLADVRQVPAAHYILLSLDNPAQAEPVRYWDLDLTERLDLPFDEAARRLRELFVDSVRLHMRSDVPVGAALSGGIDSSSIVAAMRATNPRADIRTFSYIADDPAINEERWVDAAATAAGAAVHKVRATPDELVADLDRLVYAQDEPFGSTSIYAQYRVFGLARAQGIKVMLDGQGADEMLAGYRGYLGARLASLLRQGRLRQAIRFARLARHQPGIRGIVRVMLQSAKLLLPDVWQGWGHRIFGTDLMPNWMNAEWFRARGVRPPSNRSRFGRDLLREELQRTLCTTSLPMLLRYEDRNSMASSIESRVPFLTPALAQFILRLPEEYLLTNDGTTKHVFRQAMRGLVPDIILDRRDKIGFATPELRWLNELRPWVDRILASDRARSLPVLRLGTVEREWHAVRAGRRPFDFRVWRWVNLIRWADRFDVRMSA
jgi:asparagine synthase (glutamine-hydrolysing)